MKDLLPAVLSCASTFARGRERGGIGHGQLTDEPLPPSSTKGKFRLVIPPRRARFTHAIIDASGVRPS
jgi:hypothetical protein